MKNPKPILSSDNFDLFEEHGIGIENTPYTCLEVISKKLANKHVVDICLFSDSPEFEGKPVQYRYDPKETDVRHGMRMERDTLDETLEYIDVLKEAVKFANRINKWISENPQWKIAD